MDSLSSFHRMLQHELAWTTASRQLRVRMPRGDDEQASQLLVQRVSGNEAICGGIEYRVTCLADTPHLQLKDFIASPIEILVVTDRGQLRSVCGIVTEARVGDFDGGLALYHLVVRDALAVMEKRTNSRIFRFRNEFDIVQVIFDEWRQSNAVMAGAFDYELDPLFNMRDFPPREHTMQCNESDAAFVRRLLKRRGISWFIRPGRSRYSARDKQDNTPAHTLVLFNDPASLPENPARTIRYHRDDATDGRDVITSWVGARALQSGSTSRHSWDYKNPLGTQFMMTSVRGSADQGVKGNHVAATLDDYLVDVPHAGDNVEDQWRLGRLRMARHDYETKCFFGVGNVRELSAGSYFELCGQPEVDSHPANERQFIVTELQVTARNNLPKDLDKCAEDLISREHNAAPHASEPGFVQVRFSAVRRGVPIVPSFDPRSDLPQPQMQTAIVVGPPGEEVHCDQLGRVKIRFPGMRASDHKHAHGSGASDSQADSAWVRVASDWAGNGPGSQHQCGFLGLPRVGTEVLVAFLGGDPDKPIIVGQLYNQRGTPPALSPTGELPGNRYLSGMRSREVGGQRGNQLRFDDTRGQISVQLASDHAASQLNLGCLTHPRSNGAAEPRGEGAELRSDEAVAIRGGKGVLVTADPSRQAEGGQLDHAALTGLAAMLEAVVSEVGKVAEQHAGDEAGARLTDLANKIRSWDAHSNNASGTGGDSSIVAVTAPDGIMVGSPETVAIGSETTVDVASAGDAEIFAGKHLLLRAVRYISLFAYRLGIKLTAERGDINLQTHQGNVEIKATGRITLTAAGGIDLQAPNIRVVAQGAQADWGGGRITEQTVGQHMVKAASFVHTGPGTADPARPAAMSSEMRTDERVVLQHRQTGEPLPNVRYSVLMDDGSTFDGVTDQEGRSTLLVSDLIRGAKVTWFYEDQA